MKKRLTVTLGTIGVLGLLVFAFWYGGNAPGLRGFDIVGDTDTTIPAENQAAPIAVPPPIDPDTAVITDTVGYVTLSVTCTTALEHLDMLKDGKYEVLPPDGVLFAPCAVEFYEGESVFHATSRALRESGIHLEFTYTPLARSAYIEGIGNLYEFDCGEGSGWLYKVNGAFPPYGCSLYGLHEGDTIEWVYTCDFGTDVGQKTATTAQNG